jgi:hypothetical protein
MLKVHLCSLALGFFFDLVHWFCHLTRFESMFILGLR